MFIDFEGHWCKAVLRHCSIIYCHHYLYLDGVDGDDICYKILNVEGGMFGNCGTDDNGKYVSCLPE